MSHAPNFQEQLLNRPTPLAPGVVGLGAAEPGSAFVTPGMEALPPLLAQTSGVVPSHIQAAGRVQQLSQEAHLEAMALETYERETALLVERVLALKPLLGMCSWVIYFQGRMEHSLPLPCLSVDENTQLRNRLSTAIQSSRAALADLNRTSEADASNFRARAHHMLHWPRAEAHLDNSRGRPQQPQ